MSEEVFIFREKKCFKFWCKSHELAFSRSSFSQNIARTSLISLDCETILSVLSLIKKIEAWIFCSMKKKSKKCSLQCEKSMKKSIFSVNINFIKINSTDFSYSSKKIHFSKILWKSDVDFLKSTCRRLLLVICLHTPLFWPFKALGV